MIFDLAKTSQHDKWIKSTDSFLRISIRFIESFNSIPIFSISGEIRTPIINDSETFFLIDFSISTSNLDLFVKKLKPLGGVINIGGRFVHVTDGYNKGVAIKEFLNLIKINKNIKSFISVSLGDSHNDVSMLELTDYSYIIKTQKKKNLYLKKKKNLYHSKSIAPLGWRESINHVLNKEKLYF